MKIMHPIARSPVLSEYENFLYEVKYDGFRCLLLWREEGIRLMSRHQKELTMQFPEIRLFCQRYTNRLKDLLPLVIDGELVILNHPVQANFSAIQTRGRLQNEQRIEKAAKKRPAHLMAFDLLQLKGEDYTHKKLEERKDALQSIFNHMQMNTSTSRLIQYVEPYVDKDQLQRIIFEGQGEGMIAKRKGSLYVNGKNHYDWFKIKNWRTIQGCLTRFNPSNGYFNISVHDQEIFKEIGTCKHGLNAEEREIVKTFFLEKGDKQMDGTYTLPPAICAAIHTLEMLERDLREPTFAHLLPNVLPKECTMDKVLYDVAQFPKNVELTNISKLFWPKVDLTKGDLLLFLRYVAPYMLPFLKGRALTIIRCPEGIHKEAFYQKSLPPYAPSFFKRLQVGDKQPIICQTIDSLLWLANHGAIEYHIPFQYVTSDQPVEIIFDLDPPDQSSFLLAVQAARLIKQLLDDLQIRSFIKTSGRKGLQVHIPVKHKEITYDETAIFTEAVALTIERSFPNLFTTERLKKNRHGRLYIDYVQHGKNKTLIAPYSPRVNDHATVATPLFWDEVNDDLNPKAFTVKNVVNRIKTMGCPWLDYKNVDTEQNVYHILRRIH